MPYLHGFLVASEVTEPAAADQLSTAAPSVNGALWGVVGLLVLLIGTYLGLRWLSRRQRTSSTGKSEILERIALTRDAHVAIVRVGSRVMALGISKEGVRYLEDLDPLDFDTGVSETKGGKADTAPPDAAESAYAESEPSFGKRFIHNLGVISGFRKRDSKPIYPKGYQPSGEGVDFAKLLSQSRAEYVGGPSLSEHPNPSKKSNGVSGNRYAVKPQEEDTLPGDGYDDKFEDGSFAQEPDEFERELLNLATAPEDSTEYDNTRYPPLKPLPPPQPEPQEYQPSAVNRNINYQAALDQLMQYNNPDRAIIRKSEPKPPIQPMTENVHAPVARSGEPPPEPTDAPLPDQAPPPTQSSQRKTPPPIPRGRKKRSEMPETIPPEPLRELPSDITLMDMLDKSLKWEDSEPSQDTVLAALDAIENATGRESETPVAAAPMVTTPAAAAYRSTAPAKPESQRTSRTIDFHAAMPPAQSAPPVPPVKPAQPPPPAPPANSANQRIVRGYGNAMTTSGSPAKVSAKAAGVEYIPSAAARAASRPTQPESKPVQAPTQPPAPRPAPDADDGGEQIDQLFDMISKRSRRFSERNRDRESR